jgi:hypothetical protein
MIRFLPGAISFRNCSSVNSEKTLSVRATVVFQEAIATLTVNCSCVMIRTSLSLKLIVCLMQLGRAIQQARPLNAAFRKQGRRSFNPFVGA